MDWLSRCLPGKNRRRREPPQHTPSYVSEKGATSSPSMSMASSSPSTSSTQSVTRVPAPRVNRKDMIGMLKQEFEDNDWHVSVRDDIYYLSTPRALTEAEVRRFTAVSQ